MSFNISIPNLDSSDTEIVFERGGSTIFVGANGSGKTRLAVFIEKTLGEKAHRISAHRALDLNPDVPKIREESALRKLRYGYEGEDANIGYRSGHRWKHEKEAITLLNDFDGVLQALFAEQSNTSLETHKKARNNDYSQVRETKFETLSRIWQRVLPERELLITGDDIHVKYCDASDSYSASQMSDGERAVFYLIGQGLLAEESSLLIIDEPELHVHPSIMSKLWDEIEAARPDCSFVFITHDLNFSATRSAQKYVIRSFDPAPKWNLQKVTTTGGFTEEITTLILGSRHPILFVEGSNNSLDLALYRACYPDWTVIPHGSCESVIHAVSTLRNNPDLLHATAIGIVDADSRSEDEISNLKNKGVFVLPVSEIENLFLLPEVAEQILKMEGHENSKIEEILVSLKEEVFATLNSTEAVNKLVILHCQRKIDSALKSVEFEGNNNLDEFFASYQQSMSKLDIEELANNIRADIEAVIESKDLEELLAIYDNKGLLALAAQHLRNNRKNAFEQWLTRILRDEVRSTELINALKAVLPNISEE